MYYYKKYALYYFQSKTAHDSEHAQTDGEDNSHVLEQVRFLEIILQIFCRKQVLFLIEFISFFCLKEIVCTKNVTISYYLTEVLAYFTPILVF